MRNTFTQNQKPRTEKTLVDIHTRMPDMSAALTEHRRKRVRKGTKSCWECRTGKRRKIRCDFLDSEAVCAGCAERGSKCVSQEFEDDQAPLGGMQLGQRMGRVEMLLERLMEKVDSSGSTGGGRDQDRDQGLGSGLREPLGIDVLTPSSSTSNQYEHVPILSLFDNAVFGRSPASGTNARNDTALYASPPLSSSQTSSPSSETQSKLESLRRTLVSILPSQHDADLLLNGSDGFWLLRRHILPQYVNMPDHDFSKPFNIQAISQSHPIALSRLLLVVALCIQQLPRDYDASQLQFVDSLKDRKEKIVLTVANITSDDELIGSLEGIECLILQGIYHINAGNLRRSWLLFRRATNIAQLMGLHRPPLRPNDPEDLQAQRKHYLWFQLVKGDRFLSLILGLPAAGSSSEQFPFDDTATWLTAEDKYNKHLSTIAGLIVDRNQAEPTHAFSTTQKIDEELENLAREMPSSWWELPESNTFQRNEITAELFDRALIQTYHYELESLVHLPYMLRAAVDRRYEYSRLSCLSASRKLIHRWLFLRNYSSSPLSCKMIEFQALKATITLLLGILQPSQTVKDAMQIRQEDEDRKLVDLVRNIFDEMQAVDGDIVLAQSAEVLKTLQCVNLNDHGKECNIRLTIPHFGTISVGRGRQCNLHAASTRSPPNLQGNASMVPSFEIDRTAQSWQNDVPLQPPRPNPPPVLTFTSSQFPPLTADMGEWRFNEDDTLLFNSLLDTDLEGNWNF